MSRRGFCLPLALWLLWGMTAVADPVISLINLDLGYPVDVKTGPAAVGQGPNDFWNIGWYSPVSNPAYANGSVSAANLSIVHGIFGSYCGSSDPMYNSYVFNNGYASEVDVIAENLVPGTYDIYAYSPDASFTLTAGPTNLGTRACYDSPLTNPPAWQEGRHYVLYTNVLVGVGDTVTLRAGGWGKISGLQIVGLNPAVAMIEQPQSQTNQAGENVVLSGSATGTPDVAYQWRLEGTNLPGATAATLSLTNVQFAQQGNYSLLASNWLGVVYSSNAFLTVQAPPVIHAQPVALVLGAGSDAFFSAEADGSPVLSFQWQHNGNPIAGATEASWVLANVQAADLGAYTLAITNPFGFVVSDPATLSVTSTPPSLLSGPTDLTVTRGAPVEFQVSVRGTEPLSYQWTRNSEAMPGQTQPWLVFESAQPGDAGTYQALITNLLGSTQSVPATVSVTPAPGFLWAQQVGGGQADEAKCVAADADGNAYLAGYISDAALFGSTLLTNTGLNDIFLAKCDRLGHPVWARRAGSLQFYRSGSYSSDVGFGLATDSEGNVYITGSFKGTASFDGIPLTKDAGAALFLVKYSPAGDVLWAVQSDGTGNAQGNSLCVAPNGQILLAGIFSGTNTLSTNNLALAISGSADMMFLACFDPNGRAVWTRKGVGTSKSQARAVTAARDGTICVAGDFTGTVNFDGIEAVENAATETGDAFVAAYEPGGNVLWVTTAGGAYADTAAGVACDAGGNVYVAGTFKSQARFGETALAATGLLPEIFLAKYNRNGKVLWARSAGGNGADYGNGVAVDSGGNAYVAGSFNGSANFSGTNCSGYGGDDAFVAMYSAAGNLVWIRNAGGTGADSAAAVCVDIAGDLVLAGTSTGPITLGNTTLPGAGNKDAWVARFAPLDPDAAPVITLDPPNQKFPAGTFAGLGVGFIGGPPLNFQWRFNDLDLTGETNAVLFLDGVQPADAGSYSLVISNRSGVVTSAVFTAEVAVEPDFVWSRRAGGGTNDEATAVAMDASGNVYVAGYFSGTADFSGTPLVSNGGTDVYVAKYNSTGTLQWVRQAGGTGDERVTGLALDGTGTRVFVCGYFNGTANFGVTNLTSAGNADIFLAQLDTSGSWIWASQAGGTLRDGALGIAVDDSGNAYITGYYQGSVHFDSYALSTGGTSEAFVAKYNTVGRTVWAARGGPSFNSGRAIACDRKAHVYVAGSYFAVAAAPTDLSVCLAQYTTSNGSLLWMRQGGSTNRDDEALALCTDREGSALLSGYFQNQAVFGSNTVSAVTSNSPDLFLAKYDVSGNLLWLQQAGGLLEDFGNSLATDGCGNAYLAGAFTGTARFGDRSLTALGSADFFVALYDAAGQLVKLRRGGSRAADAAQAIVTDGKGGAAVAGYYGAEAVLGSETLASFGERDAFVTRLQLFPSNAAPVITTDPVTQTSYFKSNAVFMAGASSGTSASYQWLFNGMRILNATNSFLRVTNTQYPNMGNYSVVVSNSYGMVTSAVARLTVDLFPELIWLRSAGGYQDDAAQAVATDSQGNLFVAGYVKSNAWFGIQAATNAGVEDVFLAKYSPDGVLQWVNTAGGTSSDLALALAVDPGDNVVVAGTFSSTRATFGPVTLTNAGSQDIFLAKYDSQGGLQWAKQAGYTYADQANSVAVDTSGNIYLTGSGGYITSLGGLWLTNSPGTTTFLVAKYSPAGNLLWGRNALGTNSCIGTGITVDHGTNILVTGTLLGRVDFGAGPILNTNVASYGGTVFLANYAPDGGLRWSVKGIGASAGYGQCLRTDAAGNIFATSNMRNYGTGPLLTKYDSFGRRLWSHSTTLSCCTGDYLSGDGLALDTDGNPYVCGAATGTSYLDAYSFSRQGYVAKFRGSDGMLFWAQRAGAAANSIALDAANNAYLAGRFTANASNFGPTNLLVTAGLNDVFVAKLGVVGPGISAGPVSRSVVLTSNTVLTVTATGTGPVAYQWLFNGSAINGATNSSLTLNNFQPGNAGLYSVIVRNTTGSVTSAPATLTLTPVLLVNQSADAIVLSWQGTFTLQTATNAPGPFADLPAAVSPYTNDLPEPQRFFRLRTPDSL